MENLADAHTGAENSKSGPLDKLKKEQRKREALKRLKETLCALDRWKRDSMASLTRY